MKITTIIVRVLLGLLFAVFGSNAFLHFLPMPKLEGLPGEFMHALFASHYLYAIVFCQIAGGLLLLIGRFVPLGLTLLGPVIFNILCYHIFLDRNGIELAVVVAAMALFLLWRYRIAFAGLVKAKV